MNTIRRRTLGLGLGLLALSTLYWVPAQAQQYTLTELLPGGAADSYAYGINASGQVTGRWDAHIPLNSSSYQNVLHAFVSAPNGGALTDLGTNIIGYAVNDSGQVLTAPGGINDSGQVTGSRYYQSGDPAFPLVIHAFIGAPNGGAVTDLGTFGGHRSDGNGINASGQVTGSSTIAGDAVGHAFLYSNGTMQDLGTLGGTIGYGNSNSINASYGNGINASGQVTGGSIIAGNAATHAFLYSNGAMQDLGTLGGFANSVGNGINASGQVTGDVYNGYFDVDGVFREDDLHAFLYTSGHMVDLNSLVSPSTASLYTLTAGEGINDSGQIVANGYVDATGQYVGFLLTPTSAVPLPAAGWLMLSGVAGLGATVRRRRAT